jgi:putative ABC transport system ATP-binding protein
MPPAPILQADDIGRTAADGSWLIRHVSLTVSAGESWAISGPTGSGKTVLLRTLAMLDAINEGELRWNGAPVPNEQVPQFRRDVVYLHQKPALIAGTVEDNIQLPSQLQVAGGTTYDRDAAVASLERLGRTSGFLEKSSGDLSGGESQIVALLRAMQVKPSILLLDEPTAALDATATAAVEQLVSSWLNDSPTTRATIWVTHNADQLERVADNVLKLAPQTQQEQANG